MSKSKVVSFPHGAVLIGGAPPRPARLKAERVQEPLADEVVRAQLKAERVQEPLAAAAAPPAATTFVLELSFVPPQAVAVQIFESKVTLTFHGNSAVDDAGTAG
jgi:hypothetical protein